MANPAAYLPPALEAQSVQKLLRSVGLPEAKAVQPLQVAAAYHSVYFLHFDAAQASEVSAAREPDGSLILVLRVAGRHLPRIKTLNEVGVIRWVRANTDIPVPGVVRSDASEDNPIGHEYVLLEKAPGISVDKIYNGLDEAKKRYLVEQLTDYVVQLHSKPWTPGGVSGLVPDASEDGVLPGPPIDETFWQLPDIPQYWGPDETLESLNPFTGQPFPTWIAYVAVCLERYIHAINVHPSLAPHRDLVPRLQALHTLITSQATATEFDSPLVYVLAHKDLHFGNIMCEPETARITAVLDWEFAGVVPAPRWNPVRAFLWNYQDTAPGLAEKYRLMAVFEEVCRERGAEWLLEQTRFGPRQEALSTVVNHVRAIVEFSPRGGTGLDRVAGWRKTAEAALEQLGL